MATDRFEFLPQSIGGCVALGEDHGGANVAEDAGVDGLLVAAGAGEGDQDRRFAEVGNGAAAKTAAQVILG